MAIVFRVALLGLALTAASADAGIVCRSAVMIGFEAQAKAAAAVLGDATNDPASLRIYSQRTRQAYFYASNFVRPGQRDFTKIVSDTPLTPRQVVLNVMYVFPAEVAANAAATELALASVGVATVRLASIE